MSPRKLAELEGLRGLLAWWVVADHLLRASGYWQTERLPTLLRWLRLGGIPVEVFVALSGFVIMLTLDAGRHSSFFPFVIRRFFRIYPAYLLCLTVAVVLVPAESWVYGHWPWEDNYDKIIFGHFQQAPLAHAATHLFLAHGAIPDRWLPDASVSMLGPAWSISLEWQFYLIAPLVFMIVRSWRIGAGLVSGGVAAMLAMRGALSARFGTVPAFLPVMAHLFFVGGVSYFLWRQCERRPSLGRRLFVPTVLAGLALAWGTGMVGLAIWGVVFGAALTAPLPTAASRALLAFLRTVPLQALGRWSYCTYLIHMPVLLAAQYVMFRLDPTVQRPMSVLVLAVQVIPTTLILSAMMHEYAEVPGMNFGKVLADRAANHGTAGKAGAAV